MSKRFTTTSDGHCCDQCCNRDTEDVFERGRLDTMWLDEQTGETLCSTCKAKREQEGGQVKHNVFDRSLYDQHCGDHPSFYKEKGIWFAMCKSCGQMASAAKPEDLPVSWNLECRKP